MSSYEGLDVHVAPRVGRADLSCRCSFKLLMAAWNGVVAAFCV